MAKHSLETKIKAVNDVLKLGMSAYSVAKLLNTSKAVVQKWIAQYEELGTDGLSMKPGTYSGDFKVHVIEYIRKYNMSFFRAAAHFGIPSDSTIKKWDRIYRENRPESLYKDNRRREHVVTEDKVKKPKIDKQCEEDLIAEVQRLRMENEYLKKLNALVQAREKSAEKTK